MNENIKQSLFALIPKGDGYNSAYADTLSDAVEYIGQIEQQRDELAEALERVSNQLKQAGASIPAPENKGTPESAIATGMSIALLLIEESLAKYRQPQNEGE